MGQYTSNLLSNAKTVLGGELIDEIRDARRMAREWAKQAEEDTARALEELLSRLKAAERRAEEAEAKLAAAGIEDELEAGDPPRAGRGTRLYIRLDLASEAKLAPLKAKVLSYLRWNQPKIFVAAKILGTESIFYDLPEPVERPIVPSVTYPCFYISMGRNGEVLGINKDYSAHSPYIRPGKERTGDPWIMIGSWVAGSEEKAIALADAARQRLLKSSDWPPAEQPGW